MQNKIFILTFVRFFSDLFSYADITMEIYLYICRFRLLSCHSERKNLKNALSRLNQHAFCTKASFPLVKRPQNLHKNKYKSLKEEKTRYFHNLIK
jgi:hypothetical protein